MDNLVNAVIYCRVSDANQVKNGNGLSSQETRCREYAHHRGYNVVAVYQEEGVTGKIADRPRMQTMLQYLRQHKKKETHVVIIDDISRLARDLKAHIELRTLISDAGGKLESPTLEFGEDSDSRLIEHMLATVAAHQREKNAEQVKNRMRARLMNGFWIFGVPRGYKMGSTKEHRKIIVPTEPLRSIVKEALEGYASGRFNTMVDVQRFLESCPEYPKDTKNGVYIQRVSDMLNRVLYAGYLELPEWGIGLTEAKHEAIITMETYNKIQDRIHDRNRTPKRADIGLDFPLRGFVLCNSCQHPLTACWSKGRTGKYAYYLCRQPHCPDVKKSVKREVMEGQFDEMLAALKPTAKTVEMLRQMTMECYEKSIKHVKEYYDGMAEEKRQIERKIEPLMQRILDTESLTLINSYEDHLRKLECRKAELTEKLAKRSSVISNPDKNFQTVFDFISNPQKLWRSSNIEHKQLATRLVFARPLQYDRKRGFQTAALTLPFTVSRQLEAGKCGMVEMTGIEPATFCLQSRRSTN